MAIIPGLSQPLKAVGKRITSWNEESGGPTVEAGSAVRRAACPRCSKKSSRLHGQYRRRLADSPSFGVPVSLTVEVQRFKCVNRSRSQRTFSERLGTLAAAGQRRTLRLGEQVRSLGYALGGAAAGDRFRRRRHRRLGDKPAGTTTAPSWSTWERRCPIELVEGRDATSVIPWLETQPTVEVIARDRAGAYSEPGRTDAPDAQQVADRWHLMGNLCEAVERVLLRHAGRMREAARQVSEALRLEAQPAGALAETDRAASTSSPLKAWQRLGVERRAARLARYEEVVRRRKQGESIKAIARAMKIAYPTAHTFARAGSFPERAQWSRGPTLLDVYRPHLVSRVAEGCWNAMEIWRELRKQGFTGSHSAVRGASKAGRFAPGWAPFKGQLGLANQRVAVAALHSLFGWLVQALPGGQSVGAGQQEARRRCGPRRRGRDLAGLHASGVGGAARALEGRRAVAVGRAPRLAAGLRRVHGAARSRAARRAAVAPAAQRRGLGTARLRQGAQEPHGAGAGGGGVEATRVYFAARGLALEGVAPETPLLASLADPLAPLSYSALHESFTRFVRRAVRAAGELAPEERTRAEKASAHWLRYTHATRAAERQVPPDVLQENLGQSDPRTTARYYRAQIKRRQKEMERAFAAE